MTMIYAAIANGGFRYQPYLVSRVDNLDGTPNKIFAPTQIGTLPVSQANLKILQDTLRSVMKRTGRADSFSRITPLPWRGSRVQRKRTVWITAGSWRMGRLINRRSSCWSCLSTAGSARIPPLRS